jgi:hypothetical protein
MKEKLFQLIRTGNEENIRLAFALKEANNIRFDYEDMVDYRDVCRTLFVPHWKNCFVLNIDLPYSEPEEDMDKIILLSQITYYEFSYEYDRKSFPFFDISPLMNLEKFVMIHTGIDELPMGFANLKHLKHVDVQTNQLTELPDELGQVETLEYLDIRYNRPLSRVGKWIAEFPNLKELWMYPNAYEADGVPIEICNYPKGVIKSWGFKKVDGTELL